MRVTFQVLSASKPQLTLKHLLCGKQRENRSHIKLPEKRVLQPVIVVCFGILFLYQKYVFIKTFDSNHWCQSISFCQVVYQVQLSISYYIINLGSWKSGRYCFCLFFWTINCEWFWTDMPDFKLRGAKCI